MAEQLMRVCVCVCVCQNIGPPPKWRLSFWFQAEMVLQTHPCTNGCRIPGPEGCPPPIWPNLKSRVNANRAIGTWTHRTKQIRAMLAECLHRKAPRPAGFEDVKGVADAGNQSSQVNEPKTIPQDSRTTTMQMMFAKGSLMTKSYRAVARLGCSVPHNIFHHNCVGHGHVESPKGLPIIPP